jgi:hypothetical protein
MSETDNKLKFKMELNTEQVKAIVRDYYISNRFQNQLSINKLKFEVKSKQNYKVYEWEIGDIRVTIEDEI